MSKQKAINLKIGIFSLTWPIFIELFLHMLLGNADTLMLSQYSDNAVAAVGVANQILWIVIIMFGIISGGTTILVSQYLGANDDSKAIEVIMVSLVINVVFGLVLSMIIFIFAPQLLKMMNLPSDLMNDAIQYLRIVGGLSFIQSIIMTITATIRSYGYMKDSMRVTIGMNILNVVGNALFIFGLLGMPRLGATGVAISTSFSRLIGMIILLLLMKKRVKGHLNLKVLKPFPKNTLRDLLRIGIPTAGEQLSYNVSQLVITYFSTLLGALSLTTKIYAQNLSMFIYLFALAIAQGTQILIGHMIGAQELEEAYHRCLKSLKIAIAFSIGMAAIVTLFSKPLLGLFTKNPEIIAVGSMVMIITLVLEPGRTFNLVIINALRAAGDVKFPVYMGIISMWGVSVTLSYLLGIHYNLGLVGMWIAFSVDEWLRGLLMLWRWRSRIWEKMSFVPQSIDAQI